MDKNGSKEGDKMTRCCKNQCNLENSSYLLLKSWHE
jgi:hypothetical protein